MGNILGLGFYSKLPQIKWLKQHLFLTVLDARNLRSGSQHGQVPDECSLSGLQRAVFLLHPHMVEKELGSSLVSFYRETNP